MHLIDTLILGRPKTGAVVAVCADGNIVVDTLQPNFLIDEISYDYGCQ
jgi:hypothetical protein